MKRALRVQFLLLAVFTLCATTATREDVLAPFFDKVQDKGTPVAAYVWKDSTAAVDMLSSDSLLRYAIDEKGAVKEGPSPLKLDPARLADLKFSAAAAARAAATADNPPGSLIRAVFPAANESRIWFVAAVYDRSGRFLGTHLYDAADGSYEGWTDSVGEIDPLSVKKPTESLH